MGAEGVKSPVHDPLLAGLALAARWVDRTVAPEALRQGRALDEQGRLQAQDLVEAARPHGLVCAWTHWRPSALQSLMLPVVVPLLDGRVGVVTALDLPSRRATVLWPETGLTQTGMDLAELDGLALPQLLVVKAAPTPEAQAGPAAETSAVRWFWQTLWRFRGAYADAMLATALANVLALGGVFFTMNVYDRVVPSLAFASLWTLALGTLLAIGFECLMRLTKARLMDLGGKRADLVVQSALLRDVMAIRMEHRPASVGVFASSMRDFESLRDFFSSASLVLMADLPFIAMFIGLMAFIGGPLAWVPVVVVVGVLSLSLAMQPALTRAMRANMKETGDRQSVLVESVLNLETIKAYRAEGYLQRRWETANQLAAESYADIRHLSNLSSGLTAALLQATTVGVVVGGVYLIADKALTLGGLIACVILAGRAISPLSGVVALAARYQQARAALEVLEGLMRRPKDRDAARQLVAPQGWQGAVRAEALDFAYPGAFVIPVVRSVSLELPPGRRLAILGRVGSGKSTLLRLLAGLHQPTAGSLRWDDVDSRQIDPAAFRAHIGFVGQDPQTFTGTLRQNLVLADGWISDDTILKVLRDLDLHTMVAAHPLGLDMPISEGGTGLSGGQCQLIALARLMLRDPAFVFLDEPTANLDQGNEARAIQVLGQWLRGRTLVMVTHRPQVLALVDRIAVMDAGRLVAEGDKAEMVARLARGLELPPMQGG